MMRIAALAAALAAAGALQASAASAAATPSSCALPSVTGERTVALSDQGADRPFLLFVPKGYDGRRALPLVLDLHGSGGNGQGRLDGGGGAEGGGSRGLPPPPPPGRARQGPRSPAGGR